MKVGVMVPTNTRPYMVRACALQLNNQTRVPDIVCFHQNGSNSTRSYHRIIQDLELQYQTHWIHTPTALQQEQWYTVPLEALLSQDCDIIFWCDDDDIYYRNHIESTLVHLTTTNSDMVIRNVCDCVKQSDRDFNIRYDSSFTAHANVGISSSMAFTRAFAQEFIKDCTLNTANRIAKKEHMEYTDQVVHRITALKFKHTVINEKSMAYFVHKGSLTSSCWV